MSEPLVEQCNFNTVGIWNPAIIQSDWLTREFPQIIQKDQLTIQFTRDKTGFSLRFDLGKLFLVPKKERLAFIPKDLENGTLDLIAKLSTGIQERLSHTPIEAAGSNFIFKLSENECFGVESIEKTDKLNDFYLGVDLPELTSKEIRHRLSFSDHTLNIYYNYHKDIKTIQYNYDYRGTEIITKKAAESLKENYSRSLELNKKLIQGK